MWMCAIKICAQRDYSRRDLGQLAEECRSKNNVIRALAIERHHNRGAAKAKLRIATQHCAARLSAGRMEAALVGILAVAPPKKK